ncbi:hypothetical protein [Actinacidiphila glaucinigra]|uniref:hypothetical protein n=1 Tax=Actinacidiphila glaucinigra TaxID=235986 RepID=UPI00386B7C42
MVTLPVDLYSATEEHGSGFLQVHASDGTRIRHRRVCEREYVDVPQPAVVLVEGDASPWARPVGSRSLSSGKVRQLFRPRGDLVSPARRGRPQGVIPRRRVEPFRERSAAGRTGSEP